MFGWSVELTNGHYKWKYGSALFGGDYTCKNNILTVDNPAYPVTATYDPETKILLWNSTEYIQDTTPKEVTILATKPKTTTCSPIDEKTAINAVKNFHIIKDYYSNILHSEYLYTNAYRPTSNPNLYVYWEVKFGELRDDALDIKKIVYVSKCGEIVGEYIPPGLSEKQ